MTKQVIVVTGGNSGIGKAIVEKYLKYSDNVVYSLSRHISNELDKRCKQLKVDVRDIDSVNNVIRQIVKEEGKINILVNNAGIILDGFFLQMSTEKFKQVIETNLFGYVWIARAVMPYMVRQRSGVVCNISSISGINGQPGQANYATAKGGIIAFTKTLAKEYGRFGIRVNSVSPGFVDTKMTSRLRNRQTIEKYIALNRFGKPQEIANCVYALNSSDFSYVTGSNLVVDGGLI